MNKISKRVNDNENCSPNKSYKKAYKKTTQNTNNKTNNKTINSIEKYLINIRDAKMNHFKSVANNHRSECIQIIDNHSSQVTTHSTHSSVQRKTLPTETIETSLEDNVNDDNNDNDESESCVALSPIESNSQLEMELKLMEDCYSSNPKVVALKTIDCMKRECEAMGLVLNSDHKRDAVGQSSQHRSQYQRHEIDFEVESIYESSIEETTNRVIYLVKWKNWSKDYNTWEPKSNLNNCLNLVEEFKYVERDQTLTHMYRSFYRLKSILEDIYEKKMDEKTLLTLLLIFNNTSLRDFNYTKVAVKDMRRDIRTEVIPLIDEVANVTNVEKRIAKMQTVLNKLTAKLNIFKRFQTIDKLYSFYEKRRLVQHKLDKWEKDINAIIKRENEGERIILENYVDHEVPPNYFVYITSCKTSNPSIIVSDDPPVYCECSDCDHNQAEECCVATYQLPIAYNRNGILKDVRNVRNAIYECNKKCKCSAQCINRVIQKGRKHKLAIFRTDDDRGWGVRALEPIQKGSYVMEYVGEIITIEEADRRGAVYDAEGRTYLFDLDYTPDEETDLHKYAVDATQCGNVSHFVNHSCDPNLDTRVAWINNLDPYMPHIALFAVRNIKLNEELTFDYKINVHGITDRSDSDNKNETLDLSDDSGISQMTIDKPSTSTPPTNASKRLTRVTCKCGAKTCRKFLF